MLVCSFGPQPRSYYCHFRVVCTVLYGPCHSSAFFPTQPSNRQDKAGGMGRTSGYAHTEICETQTKKSWSIKALRTHSHAFLYTGVYRSDTATTSISHYRSQNIIFYDVDHTTCTLKYTAWPGQLTGCQRLHSADGLRLADRHSASLLP